MSAEEFKRSTNKRRLTPKQRKAIERQRRIRKLKKILKKNLKYIIPAAAALIAAVVLIVALTGKNSAPDAVSTAAVQTMEIVSVEETPVDTSETDPQDLAAEPAYELPDNQSEPDSDLPDILDISETDLSGLLTDEDSDLMDSDASDDDPSGFMSESDSDLSEDAAEIPTVPTTANTPVSTGSFDYEEAYVRAVKGEVTGPSLNTVDYSGVDPSKANRWPEFDADALPILTKAANVTENVVCITIDDCFQAENLREIVQCALDNNGKVTIFPIGKNLEKDAIANTVKWAWENGMEIENHTYNHVGLYHYDDKRMTDELWYQSCKLSQVLGVNYKQHFFRPHGGDERKDQRVHAYCAQLGLYGVVHWMESGSSDSVSKCLDNLAPGNIYLYHTTDNDHKKLLQIIPEIASRGYRLVTLNEMFGLPDNETSDLSTLDINAKPDFRAFKVTVPTLKKTAYSRAGAVVQKRLIELGWLTGEADGEFGTNSYIATGFFQVASGIKGTGAADPETQAALFADTAEKATPERLKEMKKQYESYKK